MKISLGSRLRSLRGERSQVAIAAVLGIAQQTYAGWEKDNRRPNIDEVCKICLYYDVSADWLLGLVNVPHKSNLRAEVAESKLAAVKEGLIALVKQL